MKERYSTGLTVERYTPEQAQEWDCFVEESRNGTFLHKRGYMDYHSDRFTDHSLMFYSNGMLIAVMPAHIKEMQLCSHNGLTYGGLLLSKTATAETALAAFETLRHYLRGNTKVKEIVYKPSPHIYHKYPCEEDLYALFRNKARLTECKISTVVGLNNPLPIKGRRKLTATMKERLRIAEDAGLDKFWYVLERRLEEKYSTAPVHTLAEIELLHRRFPENIKLFTVEDENRETLGGVLLYITDRCVHMQYCGTTDEGRRIGALDYLYEYLIDERFRNKEYFDFGISVERGGEYLNSGLIAYKERLGGRAVVYSTYVINLEE